MPMQPYTIQKRTSSILSEVYEHPMGGQQCEYNLYLRLASMTSRLYSPVLMAFALLAERPRTHKHAHSVQLAYMAMAHGIK